MTFHNIRLPEFVEIFATGSPEFATSIATTISGREIIRADREVAKQRYFIENCKLSNEQFEKFNAFFRARSGQNHSFRFRDFADYKVKGQVIPNLMIEGSSFMLVKLYEDEIAPYIRKITKPAFGSVKIYINHRQITTLEVNYESGIVKLQNPLQVDETIKADFYFDVEVRFGADSFKYHHNSDGSIGLEKVELVEVLA